MRYTRTTIMLPEELFFSVKEKALAERKTMKVYIEESLRSSLAGNKMSQETSPSLGLLYGAWGKGPSGQTFIRHVRNTKKDRERDRHLLSLWKKSS